MDRLIKILDFEQVYKVQDYYLNYNHECIDLSYI